MLLLASQAEAVPASVKNKIVVERDIGESSSQLCKHFSEVVDSKRMKRRSFARSNSNEFLKLKSLHERQVRSVENPVTNDINFFARYDKATYRNISLDNSFRDTALSNGESTSLENISQATNDIKASVQKDSNGSLKLVFILLTVLGILIPIASIIYCFWTTRRSATLEQIQRRLADNENNLLNQSLPELEALMLSVQNIGCYRLGMPEPETSAAMGAPLSSQRDDSRSISTFPTQHDLIISANRQTQNLLDESKTDIKSGIKSEDKRRNIYTSCSSNCPPHIYRNDGEYRDRFYSSSSQHNAEVKRCYIQAPPNKTVQDVPDVQDIQPFNFHLSSYASSHQNSQQQLTQNKTDNKGIKTMVKGILMKFNGSSTQKVENSKINSNIASMPRSQSTDTSNELVLNGSTNLNLHSKSYVNNDTSVSLTGAARIPKPPPSSSSASSPEQSL